MDNNEEYVTFDEFVERGCEIRRKELEKHPPLWLSLPCKIEIDGEIHRMIYN